ncbi:MAG TPA: FtsK/SpoIIIE domain-containing protein, partial [Amycolatopsis sp.]|nr:FtsK/SpoIIIE domain-containing protein [Amycolatopsis sp.]
MPNPGGERHALLIATSRYIDPTLHRLRAPAQDARDLRELLIDPAVGYFDSAAKVVDGTKAEADEGIERLFRGRAPEDLVLLYISGHGIKNDYGQLFFAASNTDLALPRSTAINSSFVRDLLEECQAGAKIVLLDCCYSGAFSAGLAPKSSADSVSLDEQLVGRGTYVITATDALEYAFEGEHRYFERPVHRSMFTSMVIEALQTGAADVDRNGMITADELYDYVYRKMQPRGIQTPTRYARTEGSFTVAKTRPTTVSLTTAAKPPPVTLDHLLPAPDESPRELQPPVGRSAEPAGNAAIVQFDLTGQGGHVVVVGQIHSGKSTLVQTLVVGLSLTHTPGNATFYCIDSGGQLAALARLPHVKMVIDPEEHRRRVAMLAKITEIMAERKKLFRKYRIPSAEVFRARRKDLAFPAGDHADVFLIIDGWAQTSDVDGTLAERVRRIASDGLRFGVHVILTARSWREVPPRLADLMLGRIELRLSDPRESRIDPALAATLPKHSGYGLHEAGRFVIAQPEVDASSGYDLDELMGPEDAAADDHWLAEDDTEQLLPGESLAVSLSLLALLGLQGTAGTFDLRRAWAPRPVRDRYRVPFGVDEHGRPVELDIKEAAAGGMGPHGICVGATGSGKSELLRTIMLGMMLRHSPGTLNMILVDFKGGATFLGLDKAPHVAATITNLASDLNLVDRMKDAIAGEVSRRQEELAKGNYKNVWDYEKARENGADLDPLPAL